MIKTSFLPLLILLFLGSKVIAQYSNYNHKAPVEGIENQWHQLILPNELYAHIKPNYADIRIIGITEKNDTIEAPYLLELNKNITTLSKIEFNQINTVKNDRGNYFTFEIPTQKTINQLYLDFKSKNYNRKVWLEGSNNQNEWFTILADYRIVSIQNEFTNYQFSTLKFPSSNFTYYRLLVPIEQNMELLSASLMEEVVAKGKSVEFSFVQTLTENKENKTTQLDINLTQISPVSSITLTVSDTIDYYRNLEISYISDSVKTEKGWKYNYEIVFIGTLSSLENNQFNFKSTIAKQFKLSITNNDNTPLTIGSVRVEGYTHTLTARFTEPANYFLLYGNASAQHPSYDLNYFKENIPTTLSLLTLGETTVVQKDLAPTSALFENKAFLWGIMGIVILILGWFSLKMLHGMKQE